MSPTPVSPAEWKRAAAMMSMLALIVPAMAMARTTSTSSKRKSQIRRHRYDLGLDPQQERYRSRKTRPANLGQILARRDPQLGRHRLDEHGHEVGGEDNPQQQIPKLRPTRDVRREVPRVHVSNRSDKRGPQKGQDLANPPPVTLERLVRSPRCRTLPRKHSLYSSYYIVSPSTHENLYHLEFSFT
jgi:hypothetical protein